MGTIECGSFYLDPTCDVIIIIPVPMGTLIPAFIVIVLTRPIVICSFLVKLFFDPI